MHLSLSRYIFTNFVSYSWTNNRFICVWRSLSFKMPKFSLVKNVNCAALIFTCLIRRMGEGNVFSLFTGGGGTYPKVSTPSPHQPTPPPRSRPGWERGTPRYLPPAKVPTPLSRPGQGRGYPKVSTPPPPSRPGQDGGYPKVSTPPSRPGWGRGYPKVPTPHQVTYPPPPAKVPTPRDRTAYVVLDTLRSVCLLRLRRRTFFSEIASRPIICFLSCLRGVLVFGEPWINVHFAHEFQDKIVSVQYKVCPYGNNLSRK